MLSDTLPMAKRRALCLSNKLQRHSQLAVMTFGAACSPSIAQYIKNKNANELRQQYPTTDGKSLQRGWRFSQQLADAFWKRWLTAYLPVVTRRVKWFKHVKPIEVDDIVYIVDPNNPRNVWPKGRVVQVRVGTDGQVRSATVKTATGLYERPAAEIAVLGLNTTVSPS